MLKLKPILWPPDVKSWLIRKDSDAGKDWGQEEKGTTEDEMVGWHHRLNGHQFGWTPGIGDGQGGLAYCSSWGCKESDMTERLNWTELNGETHTERPHPWKLWEHKWSFRLLCFGVVSRPQLPGGPPPAPQDFTSLLLQGRPFSHPFLTLQLRFYQHAVVFLTRALTHSCLFPSDFLLCRQCLATVQVQ